MAWTSLENRRSLSLSLISFRNLYGFAGRGAVPKTRLTKYSSRYWYYDMSIMGYSKWKEDKLSLHSTLDNFKRAWHNMETRLGRPQSVDFNTPSWIQITMSIWSVSQDCQLVDHVSLTVRKPTVANPLCQHTHSLHMLEPLVNQQPPALASSYYFGKQRR